jgi:hypothetical protein
MLSDTKVTHRYIGTALEARGFHFEQKLNLLSRHSFFFSFPIDHISPVPKGDCVTTATEIDSRLHFTFLIFNALFIFSEKCFNSWDEFYQSPPLLRGLAVDMRRDTVSSARLLARKSASRRCNSWVMLSRCSKIASSLSAYLCVRDHVLFLNE